MDKETKRQRDKAIKDIILNTINLKNLKSLMIAIFWEEKKKKRKEEKKKKKKKKLLLRIDEFDKNIYGIVPIFF